MKEFKTVKDFFSNAELIPEIVAIDVASRINDWMQSKGKEEDEYIQKQLRFASMFLEK